MKQGEATEHATPNDQELMFSSPAQLIEELKDKPSFLVQRWLTKENEAKHGIDVWTEYICSPNNDQVLRHPLGRFFAVMPTLVIVLLTCIGWLVTVMSVWWDRVGILLLSVAILGVAQRLSVGLVYIIFDCHRRNNGTMYRHGGALGVSRMMRLKCSLRRVLFDNNLPDDCVLSDPMASPAQEASTGIRCCFASQGRARVNFGPSQLTIHQLVDSPISGKAAWYLASQVLDVPWPKDCCPRKDDQKPRHLGHGQEFDIDISVASLSEKRVENEWPATVGETPNEMVLVEVKLLLETYLKSAQDFSATLYLRPTPVTHFEGGRSWKDDPAAGFQDGEIRCFFRSLSMYNALIIGGVPVAYDYFPPPGTAVWWYDVLLRAVMIILVSFPEFIAPRVPWFHPW